MIDKECFIIMPIRTPEEFVSKYKEGHEHFAHIMERLFKPAIEKAGFKPISPVTEGSEIIQANIISKIESSNLVLCDMSLLNPNVFFELGIRTAFNKPVCLIIDNSKENVPFDIRIQNFYVYSPDLDSLNSNEIQKLAKHITDSYKNPDRNEFWNYFSIKYTAKMADLDKSSVSALAKTNSKW